MSANPRRCVSVLWLVAGLLFTVAIVHSFSQGETPEWIKNGLRKTGAGGDDVGEVHEESIPEQPAHEKPAQPLQHVESLTKIRPGRPSFQEIALKYGTDKVTTHRYYFMYEKYFPAIREQHVKMLEIGLGCDMSYGPGASYYTWLEYFPDLDLYFMEYDEACATKWAAKTDKASIWAGDQANVTFLERFAAETTASGLFDIVVDDGGHTMDQQRTSLEHLWKIVRPGGYYFIEDLETSYIAHYGGDPSRVDPARKTFAKYVYEILDDLNTDGNTHAISHEVRSIECMRQVCAIFKKELGSI